MKLKLNKEIPVEITSQVAGGGSTHDSAPINIHSVGGKKPDPLKIDYVGGKKPDPVRAV